MKRLLIGLLLVTLLVSGCRQAVVTIPPLSAPITTTTALTWDSVASLPVGTVVELTGYCTNLVPDPPLIIGYEINQTVAPTSHYYIHYDVIVNNPPPVGTYLRVKVRIESLASNSIKFQELSRTVIN